MGKPVMMIVDERPFFRAGIRGFLSQGDGPAAMDILECDPGDDGAEAIAHISANLPDVLLLDIGYPHLGGLELAKTIVRALPGTRLVIVSSNPRDDDDEVFEVAKAGAAGYLRSKGCAPSEFGDMMRRVSKGEYPINDIVASRPRIAWRVLRRFQEMTTNVRREDDILSPLTSKESEILGLVAEGNQNKQIAAILGVSEQTVKNHISSILRKLNANDRAHAVVLGMRKGLVPLPPASGGDRRRAWVVPQPSASSQTLLN
jgi:two-component system response regulator DegU